MIRKLRRLLLIVVIDDQVVSHILFTPVKLVGGDSSLKLTGLAPMAVLPKYQRTGIGSKLVKTGIQRCISEGYEAVVVLGHPDYYPKFGFVPSVRYGIKSEYQVPDEAFMILELKKDVLKGKQGTTKYQKVFRNI